MRIMEMMKLTKLVRVKDQSGLRENMVIRPYYIPQVAGSGCRNYSTKKKKI